MGPALDVCSYSTYNIIKENRRVIQIPFVRNLDESETANKIVLEEFERNILASIKSQPLGTELILEGCVTTPYVPYFDEDHIKLNIPKVDEFDSGNLDKYIRE